MNDSNLEHLTQLTSRHEALRNEDRITGDIVIDWVEICCDTREHRLEISDTIAS